jgi:arylsulfatase A-like enzyme
MRNALKLILFAFVAIVLACGKPERRLNVMIIGVDTLRPDHLGCYGYDRDTSPNTDRLAEDGVLFENVISQSPWTLPSFATVFTSLYPTQHGAGSLKSLMRTSFPPLAMILLKHGYSTGAVINAPALKREFGVNRGFESYDVNPPGVERSADQVTADALKWIDLNREGPFFIFVHYFDPHLSYSPPAPYDTLFNPAYRGRLKNSFDINEFPQARVTNFESMKVLTPADWNHIRSLYDGEIAFTDMAVGHLIDGIEEMGLRRNTLIVFLSDHGEEFFEHEGFEHGHTLYEELLRVPLVFSLPDALLQGVRINRQVRLLDVAPTILDLLNIDPGTHIEGVSLRPLLTGKGDVNASSVSLLPPDVAYAEALLHGRERKSVTAYPWKLIYDTVNREEMLFNLEHDPGETDNVRAGEHEKCHLLEEVLFKTLFGISGTWYLEVAGDGRPHEFDITIRAQSRPVAGKISLPKIFDEHGHLVGPDRIRFDEVSPNMLKMEGLELTGKLTLAFKADPRRVPLTFDLTIDGQPATDRTFLGESLAQAGEMPFTQKRARQAESEGTPTGRPDTPYFLVWHTGSAFQDEKPVRLDEEIKQELRALGYIQ